MKPGRVLLICGAPGSGKTTLGRKAAALLPAAVFLDKDTLYGPLVESVLAAPFFPAAGRENAEYDNFLKPGEYEGLLATAAENRGLGRDVIVCAPFTAPLRSPDRWTTTMSALGGGIGITTIWIRSDERTQAANLADRLSREGGLRDAEALATTAFFRRTAAGDPPGKWVGHFEIDNRRAVRNHADQQLARTLKEAGWLNSLGLTKSSRPSNTPPLH